VKAGKPKMVRSFREATGILKVSHAGRSKIERRESDGIKARV
jgi:hypothetical protein